MIKQRLKPGLTKNNGDDGFSPDTVAQRRRDAETQIHLPRESRLSERGGAAIHIKLRISSQRDNNRELDAYRLHKKSLAELAIFI